MIKCMCTEETQRRNFYTSGFSKLKKKKRQGEHGVDKALGLGTVQRRALWRGGGGHATEERESWGTQGMM